MFVNDRIALKPAFRPVYLYGEEEWDVSKEFDNPIPDEITPPITEAIHQEGLDRREDQKAAIQPILESIRPIFAPVIRRIIPRLSPVSTEKVPIRIDSTFDIQKVPLARRGNEKINTKEKLVQQTTGTRTNYGIYGMVDTFFAWLNRMLGGG